VGSSWCFSYEAVVQDWTSGTAVANKIFPMRNFLGARKAAQLLRLGIGGASARDGRSGADDGPISLWTQFFADQNAAALALKVDGQPLRTRAISVTDLAQVVE
jgi:hypothetical protein